jgi:23S rRNA (pseudouridine1915-N3)-methyltransferase
MKVLLLMMGRTDAGYWMDALKEYIARLKHYITFEAEAISEVKNTRKMTESQQKEQEGKRLLNVLRAGDHCVLLDERGRAYTSKQFAAYLDKKMQAAPKRLVFVIGGPYGFSDAVYARAAERISLSKMTFSHQMIRPIFAEQLYRAMTILCGEAYHHESPSGVG